MAPRGTQSIPLIPSIAPLARGCDAWISDIWGVLHNGETAFARAGEACVRFRESGGTIVLVSNAPQTKASVAGMLDRLGVPREAFDDIVTSGDVTRELIRPFAGRPIHHLGPDRYLAVFAGLGVGLAPAVAAEAVVCTGLIEDETETPDDYRQVLAEFLERSVPMICVNPDIVVERGERLIYCAGALAEAYEAIGGTVAYAGKPHTPIYERALALIGEIKGAPVPKHRILAIGDGIGTDVRGAGAHGLRSVFIASALHVEAGQVLDTARLAELFDGHPHPPIAAQTGLAW